MKIRVTMQRPDVLDYVAEDAFPTTVANYETDEYEELDPDSDEYWEQIQKREDFKELCSKWFQYGESVTLEIDTEEETCVVIEKE